jgi:hypothetical protein
VHDYAHRFAVWGESRGLNNGILRASSEALL